MLYVLVPRTATPKHYQRFDLSTCPHLQKTKVAISSEMFVNRGPGSVVGIATTYDLDGPGIELRCGEIFRTRQDRP